jgi:predicted RNA-binding protein with TRAM domain
VHASAGNGAATVTWSPPLSTGAALTGYTVTAYLASIGVAVAQVTVSAGTTSATFTGLSNGAAYTFTVSAGSTSGSGPESARSNAVTPGTPPLAPSNLRATAGGSVVTLTWTPPASDGGLAIIGYTVTAYLGSSSTIAQQVQVGAGQTAATLTGLTPGRSYSFTVTAQNGAGSGAASARSNLVTLATVPDAPVNVRATPTVGAVSVNWNAPPSDGASPITGYVVSVMDTATGRSTALNTAGSVTGTMVTGLTNGRTYTVTVTAVNAMGESLASTPSNPVTLPSAPDAPTNLRITPGDMSASISWTAPASNGGAAITWYVITASDGIHTPVSATSTTTSVTLPGLTNDVTYSISVAAANAVGKGPAAAATVVPRNLPPVLQPLEDRSVQYSDDLSFDVSATDTESGDHLSFTAVGLPSGLSLTDHSTGSATISGTVQAAAGTYEVTVSVSDGRNPAVTRSLTITVTPETAVVSLPGTNPSAIPLMRKATTSGPVTLSAVIGESADSRAGDITSAAPVTCTLTGFSSNITYSRTATVRPGSAQNTLAASCPFNRLPIDEYRVAITTSGTHYAGSADGMLAIYRVSKNVLRAAGSLTHDGITGDVIARAQYTATGRLKGSLRYVEHRSGGDVTLQSGSISALIVRNGRIYVQGTATLNGVGGYRFAASLLPGSSSQFGLWVTDAGQQTVANLTFAPAALTSGQATVTHRR